MLALIFSALVQRKAVSSLFADGFQFYRLQGEQASIVRLVTAFNTQEADVTAFIEAARRYCVQNFPILEAKV
jgi:threonine aldolase